MQIFSPFKLQLILLIISTIKASSYKQHKLQETKNIEFIIQVSRHGARYSLIQDPNSPLTEFGEAQQYILGEELRNRYIETHNLIDDEYNPEQIRLCTSPKLRTKESLKWQLSGLYPSHSKDHHNFQNQTLKEVWQELPPLKLSKKPSEYFKNGKNIYQQSPAIKDIIVPPLYDGTGVNEDFFFHSYDICPSILSYQDTIKQLPVYKQYEEKYDPLWPHVVKIINKQQNSEGQQFNYVSHPPKFQILVGDFLDLYQCNKFQGNKLHGFNRKVVDKLKKGKTLVQILRYKPDYVHQLSVYHLFTEINTILTNKFVHNNKKVQLDSDKTPLNLEKLKMILYSGHDITQNLIMMNIVSEKQQQELGFHFITPPFSSTFVFEIFSTTNQQQKQQNQRVFNPDTLQVQIKLNDQVLELKNNLKQMSLTTFLENILQPNIIKDFHKKCFITKKHQKK